MCNALMHYFYTPIIIGSLTSTLPEISISTALFILNKTFTMVQFQPFINTITIGLLAREGPPRIISQDFSIQSDQIYINLLESPKSFSPTWKYTLPSQYKEISVLLTQFYNQSCVENFILDPKYERCVNSQIYNKIAGIENNMPRANIGISPDSEKFVI